MQKASSVLKNINIREKLIIALGRKRKSTKIDISPPVKDKIKQAKTNEETENTIKTNKKIQTKEKKSKKNIVEKSKKNCRN